VNSVAGSRVLVTGASGLIGRQVVSLIRDDTDVVAVSRFHRSGEDRPRWLARDLTEPGTISELVRTVRPEIILHLAGSVRGDRSLDAVSPTLRSNLVATVELLEAAAGMDCCRVVVSGSLLEEPADDGFQAVPPSPYGASRWAASAYARMFHALFGLPVVILRPSFAYGPGQERTKLIPYVITSLLAGESPKLSSGQRLLDCVYAEDVARAYVAAASAPGIEGRTIDLGSGTRTPVHEIVRMTVEAVGPTKGRPLLGALVERPLEQEVAVDVDTTARLLGWRATTTLEEGLRRTVAWYRRHPTEPELNAR
jgi:UDP-glucose 4-epimerase